MKTLTALLLTVLCANAHELQDNRATLVLRDKAHIAVTLYLNYSEALYLALAPQRPYAAFLLVYSAMKPEDLQKELNRAQAHFQASTRIFLRTNEEAALTNWQWPNAAQVQASLRQQIMQATVDPATHSHPSPAEVHADALTPREINSLHLQLPKEFGKVLVVSYRPNQAWVDPAAGPSPEIKF